MQEVCPLHTNAAFNSNFKTEELASIFIHICQTTLYFVVSYSSGP